MPRISHSRSRRPGAANDTGVAGRATILVCRTSRASTRLRRLCCGSAGSATPTRSCTPVHRAIHGKLDAVAKGVRKTRSRMAGHVEPLTQATFQLAKGKSLDIVTQVETGRVVPGRAR